jgi:Inverse autotransporter, beta-domain
MRKPLASSIALTLGLFALATPATNQAGQPFYGPTGKEAKATMTPPVELPLGSVTVGGLFSESLNTVYLDTMTALWRPGNAVLFYNGRNTYDDNSQYVWSPGLVLRYLVPDHDVILGINGYYDFINSQYENQFGNVGLGAEILTKWVDARFNYYLPTTDDIFMGNRTHRSSSTSTGTVTTGNTTTTTTTTTTRTQQFQTWEADLEGFNAEIGFLIPGLERYIETRIFGGYYQYNNPFGSDFEGFKARLEAHLLPGVIADVAYWDDAYLNGGHWVAGARVHVPFDIFNLARGRNPFEGAGEAFRPRQREFRERLSDSVIRSHEVKTVKGEIKVSDKITKKTSTSSTTTAPPPVITQPPTTPPPSTPGPIN